MATINCDELAQWQGQRSFSLLDVRLSDVRKTSPATIAGSIWRDPPSWINGYLR